MNEERCPKTMVYGPCGGVQDSGACEVPGFACPFVKIAAPRWRGEQRSPREVKFPTVVVDLRPDLRDPLFEASIAALVNAGVGGLIGDHLDDPADIDIPEVVRRLVDAGLGVIATVACRGRSLSQAESAVSARLEAGATAVLCVTGDHPSARFGGSAPVEFPLDSVRLAALARQWGSLVAVAANPASAPESRRVQRLVDKQHAGADLAILNHSGDVDALAAFAVRARDAGVQMALTAPVPVITDRASLAALTQFPGVHLPRRLVDRIFGAANSQRAGVEAAVDFAREILGEGHYQHVNLSGRASKRGQMARNELMAAVATAITDG